MNNKICKIMITLHQRLKMKIVKNLYRHELNWGSVYRPQIIKLEEKLYEMPEKFSNSKSIPYLWYQSISLRIKNVYLFFTICLPFLP